MLTQELPSVTVRVHPDNTVTTSTNIISKPHVVWLLKEAITMLEEGTGDE